MWDKFQSSPLSTSSGLHPSQTSAVENGFQNCGQRILRLNVSKPECVNKNQHGVNKPHRPVAMDGINAPFPQSGWRGFSQRSCPRLSSVTARRLRTPSTTSSRTSFSVRLSHTIAANTIVGVYKLSETYKLSICDLEIGKLEGRTSLHKDTF